MKRLLTSGLLVAASFGIAGAASAAPGGYCDGKVDVVCRPSACEPDSPCTIQLCALWSGSKCLAP